MLAVSVGCFSDLTYHDEVQKVKQKEEKEEKEKGRDATRAERWEPSRGC